MSVGQTYRTIFQYCLMMVEAGKMRLAEILPGETGSCAFLRREPGIHSALTSRRLVKNKRPNCPCFIISSLCQDLAFRALVNRRKARLQAGNRCRLHRLEVSAGGRD